MTATVVLAGADPVSAWLCEEYALAGRAGLVQPVLWVTGGTASAPLARWVGAPVDDEDADEVDLIAELTAYQQVRLVRVVLAGHVASGVEPVALQERLMQGRPVAAGQASVVTINLLVPSEDRGDDAAVGIGELIDTGAWANVVASPEDRLVGTLRASPIKLDENYIAHALCSLASAGLWTVMGDEGPFDHLIPHGQGWPGGHVVVARTSSRTVAAPSAADRVAGRALRHTPPDRAPFTGQEIHPFADHPDTLAQEVAKGFLGQFDASLGYHHTPRLRGGRPRYVGLLGLLRYLWDWIRGAIKRRVEELKHEAVSKAKGAVEETLQRTLAGGDRSILRVRLFPGRAAGSEVEDADQPSPVEVYLGKAAVEWGYESPAEVWRTLRRSAFSLLDGGELGVPVDDGTRGPELATVIRDPRHVIGEPVLVAEFATRWPTVAAAIGWPADDQPGWDVRWIRSCQEEVRRTFGPGAVDPPPLEPDEVLADAERYLDELEERMARSYLGRVAQGLCDEVTSAGRSLQWSITKAQEAHDLAEEFRSGRRRRRLILRILLLVVVAAALVAAVALMPLAGLVAVAALALAGVVAGFGSLASIVTYFRDRFIAEHQLEDDESDYSYARRIRLDVVSKLDKLSTNYELFSDWCETIAAFVLDPYGPPGLAPIRDRNLMGPPLRSHSVALGEMDADRFSGSVQRMVRFTFVAGWLSNEFDGVLRTVRERYAETAGLSRDDLLDPDRDATHGRGTGDPILDQSARRYLRSRAHDRSIHFACRARAHQRILDRLATVAPDTYIERLIGIDPGPGKEPVASWLRQGWDQAGGGLLSSLWVPHIHAVPLIEQARWWAPEPLRDPARSDDDVRWRPVAPDQLVYQAVLVETTGQVEAAQVAVLAPGAAATPDLDRLEPASWRVREPLPRLDDDELDRRRSTELEDLDELRPGTVISPVQIVAPPEPSPSYSFLWVVDGEPLRHDLSTPVPFVVRSIGGPADGLVLVREALQRVADASGLSFRYLGTTSAFPGFDAAVDADSPLWIGWVFDDEVDRFASNEAIGLGGPRGIKPWNGPRRLVGGVATIRAEYEFQPGFGPQSVGNTLLHELGHAMNLGHVDDIGQIMHPGGRVETLSDFGPGDRTGLWLVGAGRPTAASERAPSVATA